VNRSEEIGGAAEQFCGRGKAADKSYILGTFKEIATSAPGLKFCEHLPQVARFGQPSSQSLGSPGGSTGFSPQISFDATRLNFLGRGQDLRLGGVVSFRSQQIDLSFTEPYFLDKNIAAGIDLFEVKTSPTTSFFTGATPVFQQFSYGGALRTGYQISDNLRQTWKYSIRRDEITNIQSNASLFIQLQAGAHATSSVGQVLLYDRRDNRLEPTRGYYASIGNDFAGVGFGVHYIRNKVQFGYYYPVAPEWVLSFTGEAGDIFAWGGQKVLLQDRFFVGGDNLRGFAPAGIGPRDASTPTIRRQARRRRSSWTPVPPSTAAIAWNAVRMMLFSGCCAVAEQPAVCVWKRSVHERGFFA